MALAACAAALACAGRGPAPERPHGLHVVSAAPPSDTERYCAWYGAAEGGLLYFGQAPFWSAMRSAAGDPLADLAHPGPQLVGRFDLERERLLPPLSVGRGGERSGVWDVLPIPGGPVLFTTFYETAGAVDPERGDVRHFEELGTGLNELADHCAELDGVGCRVLATRYGSGSNDERDGELLILWPDGQLLESLPLPAPPGYRSAPKTPAWDERGSAIWVTADLLPLEGTEGPDRHDHYVLDGLSGELLRTAAEPELQFAARGPDGATHFAEVSGETLVLRTQPPAGSAEPERRVVLDTAFDPDLDFAQDIQPAADGRVVVTRWSGTVHVVHPDGRLGTVKLPRLDPDGLYYTAVVHGDRLCATHCADVSVVCTDAP